MFKYHPYDGRISGPKNINANNIGKIERTCAGKDEIRFVLMGDTHRSYDEAKAFVRHVNNRKDVDFVIHAGDLADFGATDEFVWIRDIMNKLNVPYVALIGNHDCLGNGEYIYQSIFGEKNFAFQAGKVRFVCLSTCALEHDYSNPTPDFMFIEQIISQQAESDEKTVVAMHAPPYSDQFDNNVVRVFQHYCKQFSNLQFFLHGHNHQYSTRDLFEDGYMYYGCANIAKRNYLYFTITEDGYTHEQVWF